MYVPGTASDFIAAPLTPPMRKLEAPVSVSGSRVTTASIPALKALLTATPEDYALGDWVFVPGIREAILSGRQAFDAYVVKADGSVKKTSVSTGALTEDERQIIADGCLINYYRNN